MPTSALARRDFVKEVALSGGIYSRSQRKFFALYTHVIEFTGLLRVPAPFVDDSICTALARYADRPERDQTVVQLACL